MEPITDLNKFFEDAKRELSEYHELGNETNQLKSEREKLDGQLAQLIKQRDESISQTCKKRRSEIDKTYDSELSKGSERLRKAQNKRDKAKSQGVRERIADETAELRGDNKNIESSIRSSFKSEGVPGFCNTKLYYALYFPKSFGDVLIIILCFAIAFFLIPFAIYKLCFDTNTLALIIIYILDVLLFGGLYVGISRATVVQHHDVLVSGQNARMTIETNKKKIAHITKSIQNDTNESYYDLAVYDDEIAHIKQQLADVTMQKNEAINTFENVTKNIITDEITNNAKGAIDETSAKLESTTAAYNDAEQRRKAKALELSNNYEVYLGKEFMSRAKIEKLQEIIAHGTATNISEAIEEYNRQYDI